MIVDHHSRIYDVLHVLTRDISLWRGLPTRLAVRSEYGIRPIKISLKLVAYGLGQNAL